MTSCRLIYKKNEKGKIKNNNKLKSLQNTQEKNVRQL